MVQKVARFLLSALISQTIDKKVVVTWIGIVQGWTHKIVHFLLYISNVGGEGVFARQIAQKLKESRSGDRFDSDTALLNARVVPLII
jgi:hypothetical protein